MTIGELVKHLLGPIRLRRAAVSPPDIFCIAATLAELSGLYLRITRPDFILHPGNGQPNEDPGWQEEAHDAGKTWVKFAAKATSGRRPRMPRVLLRDLQTLEQAAGSSVVGLSDAQAAAVLRLMAYADEACANVGLPFSKEDGAKHGEPWTDFMLDLRARLLHALGGHSSTENRPATLCRFIDPDKAIVLPKMRVPQVGLTLRSLSHHLAMVPGTHVVTKWLNPKSIFQSTNGGSLNMVLLPWPMQVAPSHFKADSHAFTGNPPDGHGYFRFAPPAFSGHSDIRPTREPATSPSDPNDAWTRQVVHALEQAVAKLGAVHCLVMPEASLTPPEFDALVRLLEEATPNSVMHGVEFLICGVRESSPSHPPANQVRYWFRAQDPLEQIQDESLADRCVFQGKHHRWKLDSKQVLQYGIGASLSPDKPWWEAHAIHERHLYFVALSEWLSLCTVICEDLARQDPVAQIIRGVGPNLVIALLADGPQIQTRWPARYASVLADDPGASVLTITSLGLCEASRPQFQRTDKSRVVALWRDSASGQTLELDLPQGANGLALTLCRELRTEWTCEGRSDGGMASHIRLASCYPLTQSSGQ